MNIECMFDVGLGRRAIDWNPSWQFGAAADPHMQLELFNTAIMNVFDVLKKLTKYLSV